MDFAYFLWLSEIKWINVDPENFMEKRVSFVNDLQICTLPCIVSTFDSYWNSVIVSIILRMNNSLALWMWMLLLRIHSSLIRLRLFDISLGCGALCCTRTAFEEDWFHSGKRYFFSFLHWIHMSVSCQLDLSIHIKISWISSFDWFMKCLIFFSNFSSHKYYSTCINHLVNRHLAIFEWEISDLLWFMNVIVFPQKKSHNG